MMTICGFSVRSLVARYRNARLESWVTLSPVAHSCPVFRHSNGYYDNFPVRVIDLACGVQGPDLIGGDLYAGIKMRGGTVIHAIRIEPALGSLVRNVQFVEWNIARARQPAVRMQRNRKSRLGNN